MHRSLVNVVLRATLCLAAAACADAPSAPRLASSSPSLATAAAGESRTYNDISVPVQMPVRIPCSRAGWEIIPMSGVEHASMQLSSNATGDLTLRLHVNAQGVTGVGLVTGDTYRASGTTEEKYDWTAAAALDGYYLTYNFNVTSAGATGNIVAHEVLHMTFDASGYPSLQVTKFDAECH
ncbi:hypothetical protein J421_3166 [Gemmatirosa kalamazoonensis]|uniref:Secreted protein n=1 Tax=Gemmatirosa kalamazoonensis TaxID=861299 RepID=W0RMR1_9BACT|nr:hypothetical protein [Gemmatirosa kalamazoonensis]AHG90703.1 hypothetical protein J421_3166 [Gemmatirosa kalamazoonensis]